MSGFSSSMGFFDGAGFTSTTLPGLDCGVGTAKLRPASGAAPSWSSSCASVLRENIIMSRKMVSSINAKASSMCLVFR